MLKHILEARETVREYPKIMVDNKGLLEDLDRTLGLIREQRYFQTDDVLSQVAKLYDTSKELDDFLQRLGQVQKRRIAGQYLRAFKSGRQDDKALAGILDRLDRVKLELMARVHLIYVGMTAAIRDGLEGAQLTKEKTITRGFAGDEIHIRSPAWDAPSGDSSIPFAADTDGRDDFDGSTNERRTQRPIYDERTEGKRLFIGSRTFDRATVIYGDVGVSMVGRRELPSEFHDCEAWDDSIQVHGGMGADSFQHLLALQSARAAPLGKEPHAEGLTR